MRVTRTYRLEHFNDGSLYSASVDYRRFITLDYNLSRYIGIMGDGIVTGWRIEPEGGLVVRITPGAGFINALFSETTWINSPPLRTSAVNPALHWSAEKIAGWSNPKVGATDGAFYTIGGSPPEAAKEFNKFGAGGEYDDNGNLVVPAVYLKPASDLMFDDPYIHAGLLSDSRVTLPSANGDYSVYAVRSGNTTQVADPTRTFVHFVESSSKPAGSLLVGVVRVRSGAVDSVDTSAVARLEGLADLAKRWGAEPIAKHQHGGSKAYDPTRIRLETDIRDAVPWSKLSNGTIRYRVKENRTTSTANDHRHTYNIDEQGNGITVDLLGTSVFHYHAITNGVVGSPVSDFGVEMLDHTHTIDTTTDPWVDAGRAVVYVNGELVPLGPSDAPNYVLEQDEKAGGWVVRFPHYSDRPGVVSLNPATYSTEIPVGGGGLAFSLVQSNASVAEFINSVYLKVNQQYGSQMGPDVWYSETGSAVATARNPFGFWYDSASNNLEPGLDQYYQQDPVPAEEIPTGSAVGILPEINTSTGLTEIYQGATMAASQLKKAGDTFVLLPPAARWVKVALVIPAQTDTVTVEVLQDAEVTGQLLPASIAWVSAEKLQSGVLEQARLPLLGHGGRFDESLRPQLDRAITTDGVAFYTTATWTDTDAGHRHHVQCDRDDNGLTVSTMVENRAVTFAGDPPVRVSHFHPVASGSVAAVSNSGVNQWQNLATGTPHTHSLRTPAGGSCASVFASHEMPNGDLYFGSSRGLMVWPAQFSLRFRIAPSGSQSVGSRLYWRRNNDAQVALRSVLSAHRMNTGQEILLDNEVEAAAAVRGITGAGSATAVTATLIERNSAGLILRRQSLSIEVVGDGVFVLDDFSGHAVRREWELQPDDILLGTFLVPTSYYLPSTATYGEVVAAAWSGASGGGSEMETVYFVQNDYQGEPVWSLCSNDSGRVWAATPKRVLEQINGVWQTVPFPTATTVVRQVLLTADQSVWAATAKGVFILDANSTAFRRLRLPRGATDVRELVESLPGTIIAATGNGLWRTTNNGLMWDQVSETATRQVLRDHWRDFASAAVGHTHYLAVDQYGNGWTTGPVEDGIENHFHTVTHWAVQSANVPDEHTHTLTTSLTAIDDNWLVTQSADDGVTWAGSAVAPVIYGERGRAIVAFGRLYLASADGIVVSDDAGATWVGSDSRIARGWSWSLALDRVRAGLDGAVLDSSGGNFTSAFALPGTPPAVVYLDEQLRQFGVAWSNRSTGFYFHSPLSVSRDVQGAFVFNWWGSSGTSWPENCDVDVSIDGQLILSTRNSIDRRATTEQFQIVGADASLDFRVGLTVSARAQAGNNLLTFWDASAVMAGDLLWSGDNYLFVQAVSGNTVTLLQPLTSDIPLGAVVWRLSRLGPDSQVTMNIYDSRLLNAGAFTHPELEDRLSQSSIGLSWNAGDDYLSNLSYLATHLKIARNLDTANFRQWRPYTMRFGATEIDNDYIGNFFDVTNSNLRSGTAIESIFTPLRSATVYQVLSGYGDFAGWAFAATDRGLFVAELESHLKHNWFWAPCPCGAAYGVAITPDGRVLVAGAKGLYRSTTNDLAQWELVRQAPLATVASQVGFQRNYKGVPMSLLGPRWQNFGSPDSVTWWKAWDGLRNLIDPDLTNTLVAGGENALGVSFDGGYTWATAELPTGINGLGFTPAFMQPLSIGAAVAGLNDVGVVSDEVGIPKTTAVVATTNEGTTWPSVLFQWSGYQGTASDIRIDASGHTELEFPAATFPWFPDHFLAGASLQAGRLYYLVVAARENVVTIKGSAAADQIVVGKTVCSINPIRTQAAAETSDKRLVIATDNGLLADRGTYLRQERSLGTVLQSAPSATVTGVDVEGFVHSVLSSSLDASVSDEDVQRTRLRCLLSQLVGANELANRTMQISDISTPNLFILSPAANSTVVTDVLTVQLAVQSFTLGADGWVALQVNDEPVRYLSTTQISLSGLSAGTIRLRTYLVTSSYTIIENTVRGVIFTYAPPTTAPIVTIETPSNAQALSSGSFTAAVRVANFETGTDGNLEWRIDGSGAPDEPWTVVPPFGDGLATFPVSGVETGAHIFHARLLSSAGVVLGSDDNNFSVYLGSQPSITLSAPANLQPPLSVGNQAVLVYSIDRFTLGGGNVVQVLVDNAVVATTTNLTTYTLNGLSNGKRVLTVRLADAAGPLAYTGATSNSTVTVSAASANAPTLNILNTSPTATAAVIPITFAAANFNIGIDGGVLVTIDNATPFYWDSTAPYYLQDGTAKTISIRAVLATSPSTPLANPEATTSLNLILYTAGSAPSAPGGETEAGTSSSSMSSSSIVSRKIHEWVVESNTPSTGDGIVELVLMGRVPLSVINNTCRIYGENSVVYVDFDQVVNTATFDGGLMYVDPTAFNGGKTYKIRSQNESSIMVEGPIKLSAAPSDTPPESSDTDTVSRDVQVGQNVFFITADGGLRMTIDFLASWGVNDLRGQAVRVVSQRDLQANSEVFVAQANTSRTLTLNGANPGAIMPGDPLLLESTPLLPLLSFNQQRTSVDTGHWHKVELMDTILEGEVDSVYQVDGATATVTASAAVSHPLLAACPGLLAGSRILFYSPSNPSIVYWEQLAGLSGAELTVGINDLRHWDFDGNNPLGIGAKFRWTIDARRYGRTTTTHYQGFAVDSVSVAVDVVAGSYQVEVVDASRFAAGDQVQIWDNRPAQWLGEVRSVNLGLNTLSLTAQVSQSFRLNDDAQVRILRDAFNGGVHEHWVRDGEPSSVTVSDYQVQGYADSHTHAPQHAIQQVNGLVGIYRTGRLLAGGNSHEVLGSDDNGVSWRALADLEQILGNRATVGCLARAGETLLVGTNDGRVLVPASTAPAVLPIGYPPTSPLAPSSSTSSESSSLSSLSTISSSTSVSSRSSSSSVI